MNIKPSQGEIWLVALDPVVGHEQAKTRPCLIVSDDMLNHGDTDLSFIIPLTSKDKKMPSHVTINPPEGGLRKVSYIMCEQMRSLSHLRFGKSCLGVVSQKTMDAVRIRIRFLCSLKP